MIPKKMDKEATSAIKKQTVEVQEDDCSIDDLLEAAGSLTPERGKELLEEVNRSREDWNIGVKDISWI